MRENPRDVRLRVGRNVRQLRLVRGFSQEQLAELSGHTNKHIGQIERGQVNFTVDIITAIAAGLAVSVAELFDAAATNARVPRALLLTEHDMEQVEHALVIVRKAARAARRRD